MTDVLARIVKRKRGEVAARLAGPVAAQPTHRSLRAALRRPGARFILEAKARSPSGHVARHSLDDALEAYAPFADALSILTDAGDFGGSFDDLRRARARFDGPILAKDFVVDPAQVSEARAAGADAVLVMLSVLDDSAAVAVMAEARRLGMDALVEVHDEEELARALALGAELIGINNRDLKTLRTDLDVTERLAPKVPPGVVLVAESGIGGRADVARLAPRVDAFLVGSSLMASNDLDGGVRSLLFGPVKLCGMTRAADVALAASAGATHAGFIFVPGTPRALHPGAAAPLVDAARAHRLRPVGVFRDEAPATVARLAHRLGLAAVQLHGRERADDVAALRAAVPAKCEIWTVSHVDGDAMTPQRHGDRTLFDTGRGGSGVPFDWRLLDDRDDLPAAFLAGGIGPANAAAAARTGAYGLDCSSGVEAAPGIKDEGKVRSLFAALRLPTRSGR